MEGIKQIKWGFAGEKGYKLLAASYSCFFEEPLREDQLGIAAWYRMGMRELHITHFSGGMRFI